MKNSSIVGKVTILIRDVVVVVGVVVGVVGLSIVKSTFFAHKTSRKKILVSHPESELIIISYQFYNFLKECRFCLGLGVGSSVTTVVTTASLTTSLVTTGASVVVSEDFLRVCRRIKYYFLKSLS